MTEISTIPQVSFSGKPPVYNSGDRYGRLMLTGKAYSEKIKTWYNKYVEAICDCGKITWVPLNNVRRGRTISCGCYNKDVITKHGMARDGQTHPIYKAWFQMKSRCDNPKDDSYCDYGARGVYVCEEWVENFDAFRVWALSHGWEKGLSLDRIDNENGIYEPDNCRWVTDLTQNRNKRNNNILEAFGEKKCIAEWVEDTRCSVSWSAVTYRVNKLKWSPENAISLPNGSRNNPNTNPNIKSDKRK